MNSSYMEYTEMLQKILKPFGRNLLYLLMSMPTGIIYFTFAVSAISLGAGLSITIVGIPIMAMTLICANKIVNYEKIVATKILNTNTNLPIEVKVKNKNDSMLKRMTEVIRGPENWKGIFYCIVKLPISIMHFTAVTCTLSLSLGITFQPVIFAVSKTMGVDVYRRSITIGRLLGFQNPNYVDLFLCPVLGIIIMFFNIKLLNKLAEGWAKFTLKF